jgi:hypothetical protein
VCSSDLALSPFLAAIAIEIGILLLRRKQTRLLASDDAPA